MLLFSLALTACSSNTLEDDSLPPGTNYYISFFGDSRDGNHVYSQLQSRSVKSGLPLAAIHLGDMISTPKNNEQWPAFISITKTYFKDEIFYPVIGNHDVEDSKSLGIFRAAFPKTPETGYNIRSIGDCFCVFLNSEDLETKPGIIGPTQIAWLESEFASEAGQSAKYRIVFVHRPLFPQNHHKDKPLEPQNQLHQIFNNNKVDMVVAGHEHSYSKTTVDDVIYLNWPL